jgi:50S ribosomal protein L16 3-hydroxylase
MSSAIASRLTALGELSVDEFMARHWQRRPCLVRDALPGFVAPLEVHRLFALATRDDVESRLVARQGGRYTLRHGPFARLPSRRRRGWTLLVQGVDLHDDAVHALMQRFRFVPDARLDDVMVSFATDGGGVGPHVDSYDVFLLQAHGRRRWRVAPPGDTTLVAGAPVKLLARFEPRHEWELGPGDLLYLPPGWGHDGVARDECTTISVGFRAPSRREFLAAYLAACADDPGGADPRYADRGRRVDAHPARIPPDLLRRLTGWAGDWRPRSTDVARFIGRWLTEPKPTVWFDPARPCLPSPRFAACAAATGLVLDRRTRMGWRGRWVFVNGEAIQPPPAARRWLRHLADRRSLDAADAGRCIADPSVAAMLAEWHAAGWLHLAAAAPAPSRSR